MKSRLETQACIIMNVNFEEALVKIQDKRLSRMRKKEKRTISHLFHAPRVATVNIVVSNKNSKTYYQFK